MPMAKYGSLTLMAFSLAKAHKLIFTLSALNFTFQSLKYQPTHSDYISVMGHFVYLFG